MSENSVVIFTRASQMLAEATTIQKAKELKDLALTAADWARRKDMGEEAIQYAQSYAFDAERRMGEMLAETERAKGTRLAGRDIGGHVVLPPRDDAPTLSELGLTKRDSSEAQKLAALPQDTFEEVRAGTKTRTEATRQARREEVTRKVQAFPTSKYRVIYADPPWSYGDTRDSLPTATGATTHYPTMTIADLCALPIADLVDDNAVLFLWVTSPLLAECWPVIKAWGFVYKSSMIWHKLAHNIGHYNSVRHEFLLIATRGSCLPDIKELLPSVVEIKRGKHSEKPEEFRAIIDKLYPYGRRIELFARHKVDNWSSWGNESE